MEENAATAKTLEHQAKAMDERVAFFKLAVGAETVHAAPSAAAPQKPALAPTRGPAAPKPAAATKAQANGKDNPVARMQTTLATALKQEPDWKEF